LPRLEDADSHFFFPNLVQSFDVNQFLRKGKSPIEIQIHFGDFLIRFHSPIAQTGHTDSLRDIFPSPWPPKRCKKTIGSLKKANRRASKRSRWEIHGVELYTCDPAVGLKIFSQGVEDHHSNTISVRNQVDVSEYLRAFGRFVVSFHLKRRLKDII